MIRKAKNPLSQLNNEKGFTLAEVLVALLIMVILLSIGVTASVHYSKKLKQTELDNAAKSLFIAAQNHLSQADAAGLLDRYEAEAPTADFLGVLMPAAPEDKPDAMVWPAVNDRYYYVTKTEANLTGSILKDMLPFGAISEDLRKDGYFIVEYDLKTASLYGVFYAEQSFGYGDAKRDDEGGVIGYYGGSMARELPAAESSAPEITVNNGDTLEIKVVDRNYYTQAEDGRTIAQTSLTLYVTGMESGNTDKFRLNLADNSGGLSEPSKADANKEKWWSVASKNDEKGQQYLEYIITLDDVTKAGGHFADICKSLIPGEDISVRAVCESRTTLCTVRESEVMTSSLFAKTTGGLDALGQEKPEKEAVIETLRHLENLDSTVSGLPQELKTVNEAGQGGKALYTPKTLVTSARQAENIDYSAFTKKLGANIYAYGIEEGRIVPPLAKDSYYPIQNRQLKEYDGRNFLISNVHIEGQAYGGMFASVSSVMTVKNLGIENMDALASVNCGAVAAMINAEGQTVTVSDAWVFGEKTSLKAESGNAGGLVGTAMSDLQITGCAASLKNVASSNGDAGGLVGAISGGGKIENSYSAGRTADGKYLPAEKNAFNVQGGAAGGLVGSVNSTVSVNDCYSTCSVYATAGAGGIVGADETGQSKYTDCYATGLIGGSDGSYRGAFAGYSGKSSNDDFVRCKYLKDINSETVTAAGLGTCNAAATDYDTLKRPAGGTVITRGLDTWLRGMEYPFAPVNKTGLKAAENQNAAGVHYGDWPEKPTETVEPPWKPDWTPDPDIKEPIDGTCTFAYREVINGKSYWYAVITAPSNGGVGNRYGYYDSLLYGSDYTLSDGDWSYGILMPYGTTKLSNYFTSGFISSFFGKTPWPETVELNGEFYEYFEIIGHPTAFKVGDTGIYEFPNWKVDSGANQVTYYFNPEFGVALSVNEWETLGTDRHPYQIRSYRQLANSNYYIGAKYLYTLDIQP